MTGTSIISPAVLANCPRPQQEEIPATAVRGLLVLRARPFPLERSRHGMTTDSGSGRGAPAAQSSS
ncbi:hypothetical protein SAMN05421805_101736 [Saccharopolyspora antimicrobica]|uniref:Uncharacterized protein n=1 Tax=Saccharopolyspora antimicrobica TaxID=455193 RepID=A0A1I4RXW6_9PSEU|nr:hypothetical protein ATL45_7633 [Saccharopolyspora antimicrobica]SFM56854.1 hypothetical protein SAMN05421805_101736 [Saccharopolyspora antimicrobica]